MPEHPFIKLKIQLNGRDLNDLVLFNRFIKFPLNYRACRLAYHSNPHRRQDRHCAIFFLR
jgi:hypothetical protein